MSSDERIDEDLCRGVCRKSLSGSEKVDYYTEGMLTKKGLDVRQERRMVDNMSV